MPAVEAGGAPGLKELQTFFSGDGRVLAYPQQRRTRPHSSWQLAMITDHSPKSLSS
jgi:hypothetical protein